MVEALEIPREAIASVEAPEKAAQPAPPKPKEAPPKVAKLPEKKADKGKLELPENWDARVGLGFVDRQNESTEQREISANGRLAWKNEGREAEWNGFYHYHSQEDEKSADRYGVVQRLR